MPPLVVYKIGGSLLNLPGLPDLLQNVLSQRPGTAPLLVVGGGAAADIVREWDRVHHLGEDAAHDLALDAMALNESLLQRLLPGVRPVRNEKQLQAAIADSVLPLLCASCFLHWAEAQGRPPLPRSWDVTSDSIAAWVAGCLSADELVLLKSAGLPPDCSLQQASEAGLVDMHFPQLARDPPRLSWVNARAPHPDITEWKDR